MPTRNHLALHHAPGPSGNRHLDIIRAMFALVGVAAATAATGTAATTSTWPDFTEWKRQYGRTYATTAEAAVRFDAWASNEHSLEAARDANPHARFEADWTADWTSDELAGLRGGPLNTTGAEEQQPFDDAAVGDATNPNRSRSRGRSRSRSRSPSLSPDPDLVLTLALALALTLPLRG